MPEKSLIGKKVPRIDSWELVTGSGAFTGDVVLPGMLHGRILRSPVAHGRILHIDTTRAKKLYGVRAVIIGRDVPQARYGAGSGASPLPGSIPDEQILCTEKVRYVGDPIAAVAAVDRDTSDEALQLIDFEIDKLPAVFTAEEALRPGAPLVHEWAKGNIYDHQVSLKVGDVEKGFSESYYVREDAFKTHTMNHAFLETRVCLAYFDPSGKLTLWASTQAPFRLRTALAQTLGLSENEIKVIHPFVGGGFGGKADMDHIELLAACLSQRTGRPVRMEHTRADQFLAGRHRHEWTIKLKSGVKKDGTLLARSFDITLNGGAYVSSGFKILLNSVGFSDILCRTANLYFVGRRVYTNRPPCGPMRSYDHINLRFADSQHLDQIARDVGMDTIDFLLRNSRERGDVTGARYVLKSCGLKECIEKSAEASGWKEKRGKLPKLKGIGIGLGSHTSGFKSGLSDASSALVRVNEDGSVTLLTGTEDHGQGSRTIFAQMVAEILGIPLERIRVSVLDTESCPPCMGCYGSRGTLQGGRAVLAAAEDARRQIYGGLRNLWEVSEKDLRSAEGRIFITGEPSKSISFEEAVKACQSNGKVGPIIGKGFFEPASESLSIDDGTGNFSLAYGFSAQVVEVEVDSETGDVKILNVCAANDCGKALNLLSLNGQSEGSVHMGISHTFYEQLHFDKEGRALNPSFLNYKLATSLDTPKVHSIWVETDDPEGPFGAKGIGEATLVPTPGAIANAIYDATGIRIKELPITQEKILRILKKKTNCDE